MPGPSPPLTRSPGKLALFYTDGVINHRMAVNYINGVDVSDVPACRGDANALAALFADVLDTSQSITAWGILSNEGATLFTEPFSPAIGGGHSIASGMRAYLSSSLTIPGLGVPTSILAGSGHTLVRWFPLGSYAFAPSTKAINPGTDTELQNFYDNLDTNLRYFADYYGQHANTMGRVDVQFNAAMQRRWGC